MTSGKTTKKRGKAANKPASVKTDAKRATGGKTSKRPAKKVFGKRAAKKNKKAVAKSRPSATAENRAAKTSGTDKKPPQELEFAGRLNIKTILALRDRLAAALETGEAILIDAEKLESADTPTLQLLAAFANKAAKRAQSITWLNPPAELSERAELLGLHEALNIDGADNAVDLCPVF